MIKKNLLKLVMLFCCVISIQAQKANLDREYIKVKYINLPTDPILDENFRTYSVNANVNDSYTRNRIIDGITLYGFEKRSDKATLNVNVELGNVIIESADVSKREKVNKNKEGEVTSIERYYTPVVKYKTKGSASVSNEQGKPFTLILGGTETFKGQEYTSYSKAANYFKINRENLMDKFQDEFVSGVPSRVAKAINRKYGYENYTTNGLFWYLGSKKNPDYEGHQDALKKMKSLLTKIEPNKPLDDLKPELQPIVDYYLSVIPKYQEDKKRHRKIKYASYFNIAHLYHHFDMPEKAIEYANKLIENDYDKSDGKKLIKSSERLKQLFETNKVSSRHFSVETTDNTISGNDQVVASNSNELFEEKESVKNVYLDAKVITKNGEEVEGKVKVLATADKEESEIAPPSLNKYVKLYILNDEDDSVNTKKYYAKDITSVIINGVPYESVYFTSVGKDQVQGNVVDLDAAFKGASSRLCKVLYKSDKIGVYSFRNELVIKKPADKKGSSTSSMGYQIAFKKKLSKVVTDCKNLYDQVREGEFENTADSLSQLAKEYTEDCK